MRSRINQTPCDRRCVELSPILTAKFSEVSCFYFSLTVHSYTKIRIYHVRPVRYQMSKNAHLQLRAFARSYSLSTRTYITEDSTMFVLIIIKPGLSKYPITNRCLFFIYSPPHICSKYPSTYQLNLWIRFGTWWCTFYRMIW